MPIVMGVSVADTNFAKEEACLPISRLSEAPGATGSSIIPTTFDNLSLAINHREVGYIKKKLM